MMYKLYAVMSVTRDNAPDVLAINGASAALHLSQYLLKNQLVQL